MERMMRCGTGNGGELERVSPWVPRVEGVQKRVEAGVIPIGTACSAQCHCNAASVVHLYIHETTDHHKEDTQSLCCKDCTCALDDFRRYQKRHHQLLGAQCIIEADPSRRINCDTATITQWLTIPHGGSSTAPKDLHPSHFPGS